MSDNIFAEIYNRILGLFGQSAQKEESKNEAVNRLRLVLMQDRTNLTPEIMNRMRTELIEVLSRYVVLDQDALDLNIGQEGEQMALMLSIPVVRAKDESEIEEALKKESEQAADDENDEDEASKDKDNEESEEVTEESCDEATSEEEEPQESESSVEEPDLTSEETETEKTETDENSDTKTKESKTKKTKKSE